MAAHLRYQRWRLHTWVQWATDVYNFEWLNIGQQFCVKYSNRDITLSSGHLHPHKNELNLIQAWPKLMLNQTLGSGLLQLTAIKFRVIAMHNAAELFMDRAALYCSDPGLWLVSYTQHVLWLAAVTRASDQIIPGWSDTRAGQ